MGIPPGIRHAFRLPANGERLLRELDEEVRFHVEMRAQRLIESGVAREDAYAEALRRFGNVDELRDYCQTIEVTHMRRVEWTERAASLLQDLRYARRQFRKAPGFSAVAALTLALGIGATTAIFSVVSGVLLKPLPFREPDRIVQLWGLDNKGNKLHFPDPNFDDVVAQAHSFVALSEYQSGTATLVSGNEAIPARFAMVSHDYFNVLSVTPEAGRFFVPEEQRVGAPLAAVISDDFWQRQFGRSPSALGARFRYEGAPVTVVGVLPRGMEFPEGTEIFIPREMREKNTSRTAHNWSVLARLAPGATAERAHQELSTILRHIKAQVGDLTWTVDGSVVPLREQMVGSIRTMLLLLFGSSAALLFIACANVLNLLVARMASREEEIAVRLALGASRGRLAQQLITETSLLAFAGCIGGLALSVAGMRVLLALRPTSIPRVGEVGIDGRVLAFAIGASAIAALALGVIASWRVARGELRDTLAQAQRTQGGSGASYRVRGTLVVAQIAMTMVLLAGAAVLTHSFARLLAVDPGYQTSGVVVANALLGGGDETPAALARRNQYLTDAMAQIAALPAVSKVGATSGVPLSGAGGNGTFLVLDNAVQHIDIKDLEHLFLDKTRTGYAEYRLATPGYFEAMGIPVLEGRTFDARDRADGPNVAVISASLAKKQWPGQSALGKVIEYGNMDGDMTPMTIVGVVGDVRERGLDEPPRSTFYANFAQRPSYGGVIQFTIATSTPAATLTASRQILNRLRSDIPVRFTTIEDLVSRSLANHRFMLLLVGIFGSVALVLASLGVYSVIAYLVTQRERELSIRLALGARGSDLARLVLAQGLWLALVGILVGIGGALAGTKLLTSMLYETSATDPFGFAVVVMLLFSIATIASYVPARRAARVDPMDVLRGG